MPAENPDNVMGRADWEPVTQGKATSSSLAFLGTSTGVGSNHKARASLALATASCSVSPALAHPGRSGKTADQRPACSSYSTSSRNFILELYPSPTCPTTTSIRAVRPGLARGPACAPRFTKANARDRPHCATRASVSVLTNAAPPLGDNVSPSRHDESRWSKLGASPLHSTSSGRLEAVEAASVIRPPGIAEIG